MIALSQAQARRIWLHAQRLDVATPFGEGPGATPAAVAHLGYVQIDTINVIERCHHHILWSRIPGYQRAHLRQAQSADKSIFEYWTHALAYVPTADFSFYRAKMQFYRDSPIPWFKNVLPADAEGVIATIKRDGPLSIRDFDQDVRIEKEHLWGSTKPSKRALQMAFFTGDLTVSARDGMLKSYDLPGRHFGWTKPPKAATALQVTGYLLDRALRAQGLVSLDSICHLDAKQKPAMRALIDARIKRGTLLEFELEGAAKIPHWMAPDTPAPHTDTPVHILSPFDPLIIQRKRLSLIFGYDHIFEAYVPKPKRVLGYFALPVLVDDEIVAAIDIKTERAAKQLLVQQWTWMGKHKSAARKRRIEEALHRFQRFQLAG